MSGGLRRVLARHFDDYCRGHRLDAQQWRVCGHIRRCRTPVLGGQRLRCTRCGAEPVRYHSCRDRHCPRCQGKARRQWAERERGNLLAVPYYHLVFTLPNGLNPWVELHPEVLYGLLFEAVWGVLSAFGRDPKRLGGRMGMTAVLHTWGQQLSRHVHLHCLVPGGAWTDAGHWKPAKGYYLFPVRALAGKFRGRMLAALRRAREQGELARITRPGEFEAVLERLARTDWVVYAKPCLAYREQVLEYLARYSHRIALTDQRLVEGGDERIGLQYKDHADDARRKLLWLDPEELIRRFLLHVLPAGLMRIRHYGFLANCCRKRCLAAIRADLASAPEPPLPEQTEGGGTRSDFQFPCPVCHIGRLRVIEEIPPQRFDGG
jgi:hypothetical protein